MTTITKQADGWVCAGAIGSASGTTPDLALEAYNQMEATKQPARLYTITYPDADVMRKITLEAEMEMGTISCSPAILNWLRDRIASRILDHIKIDITHPTLHGS